ncbi:helix-turn-helix domain-containing protein [Salinibius halmophilus]|uniref:helix-turn-helix domain-containing protein n=1 Tax=Salinibius halmophilus TaxID=1853216 RepID=UPI0013144E42|nr:helix-turn-helix transcriptional regulator [Salinibius halmophilus]
MPKKTADLMPAVEHHLQALGKRIHMACLRRKLSQGDVAERCDMSRPTVRKIFEGDSGVSMGHYLSVIALVNMEKDIDQLLAFDKEGYDIMDKELL